MDSLTINEDDPAPGDPTNIIPVRENLRNSNWRWLSWFLVCVAMAGWCFVYDYPNNLSSILKTYVTHDSDTNDVRYNLLYSVYSYPNIILPLVGGILVDKVGLNFAIILFGTFQLIGEGIFTIAGFIGTDDRSNHLPFIVAIVGRFFLGMGGESLTVCFSTVQSRWFMEKELALSNGLQTSLACIVGVLATYTMPPLAEATSLGITLLVGFVIWIIAYLAGFCIVIMERKAEKYEKKMGISIVDEKDKFDWRDIKEFSLSYWLLTLICLFLYLAVLWFNNISIDYFMVRYGFSATTAGRLTTIPYLMGIPLVPILGILSDKYGHKVTYCIVSSIALIVCYVMFTIIPYSTSDNVSYMGLIPLVLMGFGYSFFVTSIWSMIPLAVKPKVLGTAFGIWYVVNNIGFSVVPSAVGALTFKSMGPDQYLWVNVLLGGVSILGLLSSIGLYFSDKYYDNGLLQNWTMETQAAKGSILSAAPASYEICGTKVEDLDSRDKSMKPIINTSDLTSNVNIESSPSSL